MANYFRKEIIEDYKCDFCQKNTVITKTQHIFRFPEILLVFIKRFRLFPQIEKNSNKVRVGKTEYNLGNFLFADLKMSKDAREHLAEQKEHPTFEIIGLIQHYGSIDFGHYVSVCLDPTARKWVMFNDEHVKVVDPKQEVLTDHSDFVCYGV